ncbi:MAG: FtsX-like permease family protein [Pseudomonadota bacterium]
MSAALGRLAIAARFARRELRGGLKGFRVFLACLALGVAAVAAVGSVRAAISEGLRAEGRAILGGDAQLTMTYRTATEAEAAWMAARAEAVSEVVDFRSMVVADTDDASERALTQVKGVDGLYPLDGSVALEPEMPLAEAFAGRDGLPGLIMEPVLIDRLGIAVGDVVRLGAARFVLSASLTREPDRASGGFGLGPRTMVSRAGLEGTGLIVPGTLYETHYRLALPEGADLEVLKADLEATFPDAGVRWRDSRQAAPGIQRFVDRIGAFLVLVGLAALAVGGIGVSAAVRAYLDEKTATIATLKTIGATGGDIFATYLLQIGALTALGVALGLALGTGLPVVVGPLFADRLPVPALFDVYAVPVAEAALYGALTALAFALWPLARARDVRAAGLFREAAGRTRELPGVPYVIAVAAVALALTGAAVAFSGEPFFASWFAGGVAIALVLLALIGVGLRRLSASAARSPLARGRPPLRLALASLGGPGGDTVGAVLSLGLGLTVLAAIGQIDHNLRTVIDRELPEQSPAFFFIDIQNTQRDPLLAALDTQPGIEQIETAPMLRGVLTRLDGVPAAEAEIDPEGRWILRGDRGVTYAATPPPGTVLTEGEWWPEDYSGPPLVSFSAEHAVELGLEIGDTITVNVLGREITAEIASLRVVEFRDMGINFLMTFDPGTFAGAPHTHIATVYAETDAEGAILREIGAAFPNVTAIRVRDAIERVSFGLGQIASAARWAAAVTLVTGLVVLIGAAAAGERRRTYEAAVLKVLGATRARILSSLAIRSGLTGGAAGVVAVMLGFTAAWGVVTYVFEAEYSFEPVSALVLVVGGALASLTAGLAFAGRALAVRPARVLRAQD